MRAGRATAALLAALTMTGCGSDPVRFGGPGPGCTLVGGALELEAASENPVVGILPNLIVSRGEHGRAAGLRERGQRLREPGRCEVALHTVHAASLASAARSGSSKRTGSA